MRQARKGPSPAGSRGLRKNQVLPALSASSSPKHQHIAPLHLSPAPHHTQRHFLLGCSLFDGLFLNSNKDRHPGRLLHPCILNILPPASRAAAPSCMGCVPHNLGMSFNQLHYGWWPWSYEERYLHKQTGQVCQPPSPELYRIDFISSRFRLKAEEGWRKV